MRTDPLPWISSEGERWRTVIHAGWQVPMCEGTRRRTDHVSGRGGSREILQKWEIPVQEPLSASVAPLKTRPGRFCYTLERQSPDSEGL